MVKQHAIRVTTVITLLVAHACEYTASGADVAGIDEAIPRLVGQYARNSGMPIAELRPQDVDFLLAGHAMVSALQKAENGGSVASMGLLGLQYVAAPRVLVWLTLIGGGGRSDGRVTSLRLEHVRAGSYARYQHVNLPWPISDRHWVILCEKNVELAHASEGVIWEHRWSLHETGRRLLRQAHAAGRIPRLDARTLDKSVYLPANRGTWTVFDLGDNQSLILAFYDSDLGGRLPAGLVRSISKRQLRKYLEASGTLAARILDHYDGSAPIHDGFGLPITRRDARDAARVWQEP